MKQQEKSSKIIVEWKNGKFQLKNLFISIISHFHSFKTADREMRLMIDTLTRNNEDLKGQNQALINELELLKEKYYIAKQNLEKSMRDGTLLKEELTKAVYARDSLEKEVARLNGKVNELATSKKAAEEKAEFLTGRTNNLQVDLRR